jgi:hypothetical protein
MGRVTIALILGVVLGTLSLAWVFFVKPGDTDYTAMVPADAAATVKSVTEDISTGRPLPTALLEPALVPKMTTDLLKHMKSVFPAEPPQHVILAGWNRTYFKSLTGSGATTDKLDIVVRCKYSGDRVTEADYVLEREGDKFLVSGVHVGALSPQQIHAADFDLAKMPTMSLVYLAIGVVFDIFAVFTFVMCAMGPLPRWRTRWLWMIATLIGVLRMNVLLATGATGLVPFSFYLPPGGLLQNEGWILVLSIPAGAILYWVRRGTWREKAQAAPVASEFGSGDMRG